MTLRELIQQAGGINSPAMDYKIDIWNFDVEDRIKVREIRKVEVDEFCNKINIKVEA